MSAWSWARSMVGVGMSDEKRRDVADAQEVGDGCVADSRRDMIADLNWRCEWR